MKNGAQIIDIVNENYWTELIHRVCFMKSINYNWFVYKGNFGNEIDIQDLEAFINQVTLK